MLGAGRAGRRSYSVKRVLLLGGYGGFGGRIALRLRDAGFEVLVAGRSRDKAERFCAGRTGLVPVALDRETGLVQALRLHLPWALVDGAGPYQSADYSVPRAAVEHGCHYVDIADARAFVSGVGELDAAARAKGVAVLAGASSLPALSGAVVRELAAGMSEATAVEIMLSASSRGTAGASVTAAILSYLGKPIPLWRGRRRTHGHGWQEIRRRSFCVSGEAPLRNRLVALADVPDIALLPDRLPGTPAVSFFAGTDRAFHNLGLWLLSWPVRWDWIASPAWLGPWLSRLQRLTGAGSERSAMAVELFGRADGRRVLRRWTLIADRGEGPEIPSLAVPVILEKLARGEIAPGARDAGSVLTLADFEPQFAGLAVRHEMVEIEQPPPLYARVMGSRFDRLPASLRRLHGVLRDDGARGRATVKRGRNVAARTIGALFGFPAEGEHALHVSFSERDGVERWEWRFSDTCFGSSLSQQGGLLEERFGLLRFRFALPSEGAGLRMELRRWLLGPIPLPLSLAPRSEAREWETEGRFHFDVPILLPLVGLVIHYRGWLVPAEDISLDR